MSPPSKPLRIAVLEADHPLERTAAKYGTLGNVFADLLRKAAVGLSWDPDATLDITKWDVERQTLFPPSLDDIDAVLITGSRANAFDNTDWIVALVEYTRKVLTTQDRVRVVGVCYGHQIIARALGSTVVRSEIGWEGSVLPMPLTDRGKELFDGKDHINIFQMHRDIILSLPPGAENLGETDMCAIQGMYSPRRFISVQGHPEFTEEIATEIIHYRRDTGVFTEDQFKEMMGRVGNPQDGVLIAKVFLKFLIDEK